MPSENNGIPTVNSIPAAPVGAKFYFHSIADVPGVVAANTFLSIFNPLGSGKTLIFYSASIIPWATAATTATVSLNIFRTSAASAGTLIAASNVNRFTTTDANPVAEVRVGNPTVTTVGATLLGIPPAVTNAGEGLSASASPSVPSGAGFVCLPGQGVSYSTASGDVDQLWNINVLWAEL